MARVHYSALVNYVFGRLGDFIYSKSGKNLYIKQAPVSVTQPRTYRQLQIWNNFCAMSKLWHSISQSEKELWNNRASVSNCNFYGFQMFKRINLNLANASHTDLITITGPPKYPSTPTFPKNFCVYIVSSSLFCLSWSSPFSNTLYITSHFRLNKNFCTFNPNYGLCTTVGYRPSWRFIETVRSDIGYINYDSIWPTGTELYFRIRSIDKSGRISPGTHSIMLYSP